MARVPTATKSIESQVRRAVASYTVEQRHNLIQNELYRKLAAKYGEDVVTLEENWVDVKLYRPDEIIFYEVKSDLSASACIRNALGQGLHYIYLDGDTRRKKFVVVGPVLPNEQDRLFIQFLKGNLRLEFDYEWIILPESHSQYARKH